MSGTIPIVMTLAGPTPQSPASLNAQLLALVGGSQPGYTANLPGILIEDMASTGTGALMLCDSAFVETINSVTPYGANLWLLTQLGNIYGVAQGQNTNTSVYVVFSGTTGYPIPVGFTVSDGANQYVVRDGGIVGTGGVSALLFCYAANSGAWAVPANTVNQLVTSVPGSITLSVNNPNPGTPSPGAQDVDDFRSQVLQAGLAASTGMPRYLKTLLGNVAGVQSNLVSIAQGTASATWKIIVGGTGDPYAIAYAIWCGLFDITSLVGSAAYTVISASNSNPLVITTAYNHGYTTGATVTLAGMAGGTWSTVNGAHIATVLGETTFSIPVNGTSLGTYTASSGNVSPDLRTQLISINDYPNTYTVPFVVPPAQTVSVSLTWNTTSTNAISASAMQNLGAAAIVSYINSVPVGQPINIFEMQIAFQEATAQLLPTQLLTRMVFAVDINGVLTAPSSGTGIVVGDPESSFTTSAALITITQG